MKKYILVFIVFISFSSQAFSQGWQTQTSNVTNRLFGVSFLNANTGMVCGEQGRILKTTTGGAFWFQVNFSNEFYLQAIQMVDEFVAYAVGSLGTVLKTTNGGQTWSVNNPHPTTTFNCLSFTDIDNGWIGGFAGNVFRTTNGGQNWQPQSEVNFTIAGIKFTDVLNGTAVGAGGKVFKTTNGGFNWNTVNSNTMLDLNAVDFITTDTGVCVGLNGLVLVSEFGGFVWTQKTTGISDALNGVSFCGNSKNICAVGNNGRIIRTTNGGETWIQQFASTSNALYAVDFVNSFTGYASGLAGTILKTGTGGGINVKKISTNIPDKFKLEQNYPNPFNPNTIIKFALNKFANISLTVFDIAGREIKRIIAENLGPGEYEINFNAKNLSSGIYFYNLTAGNYSETKRMIISK